MDSIHDSQVAVVLNSACKVGRAGISIDSVNMIIMAVRLKSTRMKLSSFCLICTVWVSFIASLIDHVKDTCSPLRQYPALGFYDNFLYQLLQISHLHNSNLHNSN